MTAGNGGEEKVDLPMALAELLKQCEQLGHLPICLTVPRAGQKGTPLPYCTCGRADRVRRRQGAVMAAVVRKAFGEGFRERVDSQSDPEAIVAAGWEALKAAT